jgi:MFS-type transporter involved in bile tolerance (Atg22 family)
MSRQEGVIHAVVIAAFIFALLQLVLLTLLIHAINVNNQVHEAVYRSNKQLIEEVQQLLFLPETLKKQ